MRTFLDDKDFTIKRQTYIGNKSSFATVGTGKGFFRPLDELQASANGFQFGQAFLLKTEVENDVRKTDIIEIDAVEFTVQGVATHDRGSVPFKRILMTLPEAR